MITPCKPPPSFPHRSGASQHRPGAAVGWLQSCLVSLRPCCSLEPGLRVLSRSHGCSRYIRSSARAGAGCLGSVRGSELAAGASLTSRACCLAQRDTGTGHLNQLHHRDFISGLLPLHQTTLKKSL